MRPLKEECTSLQEIFDQQCKEALEKLKLTIHQIRVVTQDWLSEDGRLVHGRYWQVSETRVEVAV